MAMGIFNRRKDEGAPHDPAAAPARPAHGGSAGAGAPAAPDTGFGVPPFRPAIKEPPAMSMAPKPFSVPAGAASIGGSTGGRPAGVGVPSRPLGRVDPAERRTLVVGRGISLQGTVADAERLVVEGTVDSQMIHAAELFVAESGIFKGEVEVEDAEIAGQFEGTITARAGLVIRATGRISGVARCRKLSVEEGGQVSGRMEMLGEGAAPAASSAPALRQTAPAEA